MLLQHRLDQCLRLLQRRQGGSLAEANREAPNIASYQDAGLAQQEALSAISTTWKRRARSAGTIVNVGNLAIAVLQLEATPAATRRWYMALAG